MGKSAPRKCLMCTNLIPAGSKSLRQTCSAKCRKKKSRDGVPATNTSSRQRTSKRERNAKTTRSRVQSSPAIGTESVKSNAVLGAVTAQQLGTDQRLGQGPVCPMDNSWRVDLRLQVQSQVPNGAVGYRLVLPGRLETDKPTLIPNRTRFRDTPFYRLSPFEYPDDLRLRDGRRYRIVWIDTHGHRMRLQAEQSVPGLVYSIGPPSLQSDERQGSPTDSQDTTSEQVAMADPPSVVAQSAAPATGTGPVQFVTVTQTVSPEAAEAPAAVIAIQPAASAATDSPSEVTATAGNAGAVTSSLQPSNAAPTIPDTSDSNEVALDPQEEWEKILSRFPVMGREINEMLLAFVTQPEYMIRLNYVQRIADAKTQGLPLPKQPRTHLHQGELDTIHAALSNSFAPSYFFPLCKAVFAHLRRFGTDQLATLPIPLYPLTLEMRRRMESVISHQAKRSYLEYCVAWQEALHDEHEPPSEPKSNLSAKECREFITMMKDMRYVSLFKKLTQAKPS